MRYWDTATRLTSLIKGNQTVPISTNHQSLDDGNHVDPINEETAASTRRLDDQVDTIVGNRRLLLVLRLRENKKDLDEKAELDPHLHSLMWEMSTSRRIQSESFCRVVEQDMKVKL